MAFTVPERLYRTEDGRLARHGDPEAAFLAFPAGTELSDDEARRFGVLALLHPDPDTEKSRKAPDNKMAARPADKGSARVATTGEKDA